MLIIGSKALLQYTALNRVPYDTDYIATKEDIAIYVAANLFDINRLRTTDDLVHLSMKDGTRIEFHISKPGSSLEGYLKHDQNREYASVEVLYSIKLGHIHFPLGLRKFTKHIADLNVLGKLTGRIDAIPALTKLHFKCTEERLGQLRTPSLMKSTKRFFDQSNELVQRWFVHDHIHEVMAHNERPMYEYMQSDSTSVVCSKEMWNAFAVEQKIQCVLEEAYVIALERKLVPMLYGGGQMCAADAAFDWALMRISTNLCSGWFRRFATDYNVEIRAAYNPLYGDIFFDAVDKEKIKQIA